jgi:predicted anti-sigma-YlaC factor YlaD
MTCKELVELVTEYLEGALAPEARARFEEHLQSCKGCTNHLNQMRQTIRLAGELTEDSIPPAAQQDLLTAFRNWKQQQ